jgi:hypothetical protein
VIAKQRVPVWSWIVLGLVILALIVWRTGPPSLGWIGSRWSDFWALKPETQLSALQLLALIIGGIWVFILYHRRREGQATVRIATAVRIAAGLVGSSGQIFVRSHISNESAVVIKAVQATLTLIDVQPGAAANQRTLKRIGTHDLLLPVNGEVEVDSSGQLSFKPDQDPTLEPGECVESEVVFDGPEHVPVLVAIRCEVQGEQGTFPIPHWWGLPHFSGPDQGKPWGVRFRELYVWVSYAMLDPRVLTDDYVTITLHDRLAS